MDRRFLPLPPFHELESEYQQRVRPLRGLIPLVLAIRWERGPPPARRSLLLLSIGPDYHAESIRGRGKRYRAMTTDRKGIEFSLIEFPDRGDVFQTETDERQSLAVAVVSKYHLVNDTLTRKDLER